MPGGHQAGLLDRPGREHCRYAAQRLHWAWHSGANCVDGAAPWCEGACVMPDEQTAQKTGVMMTCGYDVRVTCGGLVRPAFTSVCAHVDMDQEVQLFRSVC